MERDIILFVVSITVSFILGWYFSSRKKKYHEMLSDLENELSYIKKIKERPLELVRHAFSKLFLILFLVSLGLLIPSAFKFFLNESFEIIVAYVQFIVFFSATAFSFWTYKLFSNVINYEVAARKLEGKIEKMKSKIEQS
ncbi:hypothetical protein [Vibrio tetraodonis]|uniref:hypothetical protein n=1 Tax=Vibrio tetraodonis TaxID=2231647 RepID=UPI000E0C0506|nr:hypothetical protein [Vibrio tetraodonis]